MENLLHAYKENLKTRFTPAVYNAFIAPCRFSLQAEVLSVSTPNRATERWIRANLETPLRDLITRELNKPVSFAYHISETMPAGEGAPDGAAQTSTSGTDGADAAMPPDTAAFLPEAAVPLPFDQKSKKTKKTGLLAKYTFAGFVQGRANEIPLAASRQLADGVSNVNPLFIYGSTGLGKTHLIQAIGNAHLQNFPDKKVLYISARAFMNDVVRTYRLNKPEQLKDRYHDLDLLLVDDIQHIGGDKIRTQEEFFFLFNALTEQGKYIVISCDRAPSYIQDLPPRLTTRFNAGLPTHITPPEYEMRVQILREKAHSRQLRLDDEALNFIAEYIKSNVRELEGALNRIQAIARFEAPSEARLENNKNSKITADLCRRAIADLVGQANVLITAEKIKEKVASYYHIKIADLNSQKRYRNIAVPRHVAIYLCRENTNLSLPDIGRQFGKRNHTTVLHSVRWMEKQLKTDPLLADEVKKIELSLKE